MKDSIVMTFGRMNPPTKGHAIAIQKVLDTAKEKNADHKVFLSRSVDSVRNPLPPDRKQEYLKLAFPDVNFEIATKESPSIFDFLKSLNKQYKKIYIVLGYDRILDLKKNILKYNGLDYNYDNIEFVEAGNLETRENYSATLLRTLIRSDDFTITVLTLLDIYGIEATIDQLSTLDEQNLKKVITDISSIILDINQKYELMLEIFKYINIPINTEEIYEKENKKQLADSC